MDPATIMTFLSMAGSMGGKDKKKEKPANLHAGNEGYLERLIEQNKDKEINPVKMLIKKRTDREDKDYFG